MTVVGQPSVAYAYDDANRLTSITQGSDVVVFTYDDVNRRSTLTYPNGIVATYGYDDANQLTSMTYTLGQTALGDLTYTYDAAGRRTSVGGSWARTGIPQAMPSATYDAANRTVTWNGTVFTYDLNGNLTSDGVRSYTWNARNQLAGLSGGTSATFAYDALGRRRSKSIGGATTNFFYDARNIVQELTSGGTPTANLLTGRGIDENFTRTDSSGTSTLLTDVLDSVLEMADASGTLQTHYTFEPFGATTTSGGLSANAQAFTGRENDGTGLYFHRARYYSPQLQRFVSEDPLGLLADINVYRYVGDIAEARANSPRPRRSNRRSTLTYPNGIVATYGYDAANQLTSLAYTLGAKTLGDLTYTYDAAGRRTSVGASWARTGIPAAMASATYDAANRIVTWGGTSFSYDPNGNLASDGLASCRLVAPEGLLPAHRGSSPGTGEPRTNFPDQAGPVPGQEPAGAGQRGQAATSTVA